MGMVLKTDAAKSPWEWIANNLRYCRSKLKFAVVADGVTAYGIRSSAERCGFFTVVSDPHLASLFDGVGEAYVYAVDSSSPHCKDRLASLELDGAVVGSDVPWDVVKRVRARIGRTRNRIDLGCCVTDERFRAECRHDDGNEVLRVYKALKMPEWAGIMAEWSKASAPSGCLRTACGLSELIRLNKPKRMSCEELVKATLDLWSEWFSQEGGK